MQEARMIPHARPSPVTAVTPGPVAQDMALAAQALAGWMMWGLWLAGRLLRRPDRWLPHAITLNAAALVALWVVRLVGGRLP